MHYIQSKVCSESYLKFGTYNAIKGERSTLSFDSTSTHARVKAELCFVHPELHFENYCAAGKRSCEL